MNNTLITKMFSLVMFIAISAVGLPGIIPQGKCYGAEDQAVYKVTFNAVWSQQTHPKDFPPNPHFSGLVGGTHNNQIAFWEKGALASDGIEKMAETGSKTTLISEVNAAIGMGKAGEVISGPGVGTSPGTAQVTFTATQAHPLATLVTMIAPSPDWFVGVSGVALFDGQLWADEVVVSLQPFDAGTDSGTMYTSSNFDTQPPETIFEITGYPFENNGSVAPLGTFTFKRVFDPTLKSDIDMISATTGGIANLSLMAGPGGAQRDYLLLGSASGTEPGFPLPGGLVTVCLNWDVFTSIMVSQLNNAVFVDFLGVLDNQGAGAAQLNLPPVPGAAGVTLYFAYLLKGSPWDFTSNPVGIDIVP